MLQDQSRFHVLCFCCGLLKRGTLHVFCCSGTTFRWCTKTPSATWMTLTTSGMHWRTPVWMATPSTSARPHRRTSACLVYPSGISFNQHRLTRTCTYWHTDFKRVHCSNRLSVSTSCRSRCRHKSVFYYQSKTTITAEILTTMHICTALPSAGSSDDLSRTQQHILKYISSPSNRSATWREVLYVRSFYNSQLSTNWWHIVSIWCKKI